MPVLSEGRIFTTGTACSEDRYALAAGTDPANKTCDAESTGSCLQHVHNSPECRLYLWSIGIKRRSVQFWKDIGNRILLDRPLLFKLHQCYQPLPRFIWELNPAAQEIWSGPTGKPRECRPLLPTVFLGMCEQNHTGQLVVYQVTQWSSLCPPPELLQTVLWYVCNSNVNHLRLIKIWQMKSHISLTYVIRVCGLGHCHLWYLSYCVNRTFWDLHQ